MSRPAIEVLMDRVEWREIPGDLPETNEHDLHTDNLPWATHEGVLVLGGFKLKCYQLSDGRRVIDADDVAKFFTGEQA